MSDRRTDKRADERAQGSYGTPDEVEIPAPKADPGAAAVDDHVAGRPLGLGHQPTAGLDPAVDDEHVNSPSQGVRPDPR